VLFQSCHVYDIYDRVLTAQSLIGLQKRSIMCDPYWVAGFLCVLIGSLSDLASFGFADMSLLAPLGAMTLVVRAAPLIALCFNNAFPNDNGCPNAID
jgi:uncharacterized ion transporter superfamily protein YfcC